MFFFPRIKEEDESDELGFTKIGGVFVVLVLGCLIAFMFSILEFLWNIRKVAIEEEVILNTGPHLGTSMWYPYIYYILRFFYKSITLYFII